MIAVPEFFLAAGAVIWLTFVASAALYWEPMGDNMQIAVAVVAIGGLSILAAQLPSVPPIGALLMHVGGSGLLVTSLYFTYKSVESDADEG